MKQRFSRLNILEDTIMSNFLKEIRKQFEKPVKKIIWNPLDKNCSYHRTRGHDTEECRALKNKKELKEQNKNINLIQGPSREVTNLKLSGKIEVKEVEILLDTGYDHNYIFQNLIEIIDHYEKINTSETALCPMKDLSKCKKKQNLSLRLKL